MKVRAVGVRVAGMGVMQVYNKAGVVVRQV